MGLKEEGGGVVDEECQLPASQQSGIGGESMREEKLTFCVNLYHDMDVVVSTHAGQRQDRTGQATNLSTVSQSA
jgi:hypothetical protein